MNVNRGLKRLLVLEGLLVVFAVGWRVQTLVAQRQAEAERNRSIARVADWRRTTDAERHKVIQTITGQLDAFKKDDYRKAILLQSSALRDRFPSVEIFRQMMKTRYPLFTQYETVDFGNGRSDPKGQTVRMFVRVAGKDGTAVRVIYIMVREGDAYRVDGVQELEDGYGPRGFPNRGRERQPLPTGIKA